MGYQISRGSYAPQKPKSVVNPNLPSKDTNLKIKNDFEPDEDDDFDCEQLD